MSEMAPVRTINLNAGESLRDQVIEDALIYVRGEGVSLEGLWLKRCDIKAVRGHGLRVENVKIEESLPGSQAAITLSGCRDGCFLDVICRDVQRALLVRVESHGGSSGTIDGFVVDGWRDYSNDANRHEAILIHGFGNDEPVDFESRNVDISRWPGSPLTVWSCNLRRLLATECRFEAARPVRLGMRYRANRLDRFELKRCSATVPLLEVQVTHHWPEDEARTTGYATPNVVTPAGWGSRLTATKGQKLFLVGEYERGQALSGAFGAKQAARWPGVEIRRNEGGW